ncbi:MAG: methylated-DNA--[protein]-cysteine S-methyltransferase [Acidobacteriota bacterium]
MEPLAEGRIETPLGPMVALADDDRLYLLEFADRAVLQSQIRRLVRLTGRQHRPGDSPVFDRLSKELEEYFGGRRRTFSVPLAMPGTAFQRSVWEQLLAIPPGRTSTYGEIARHLGKPQATRAVGKANGDNRLTILVPCHRLVGQNGSLTGYGGGLWRKRFLLEHESKPR